MITKSKIITIFYHWQSLLNVTACPVPTTIEILMQEFNDDDSIAFLKDMLFSFEKYYKDSSKVLTDQLTNDREAIENINLRELHGILKNAKNNSSLRKIKITELGDLNNEVLSHGLHFGELPKAIENIIRNMEASVKYG